MVNLFLDLAVEGAQYELHDCLRDRTVEVHRMRIDGQIAIRYSDLGHAILLEQFYLHDQISSQVGLDRRFNADLFNLRGNKPVHGIDIHIDLLRGLVKDYLNVVDGEGVDPELDAVNVGYGVIEFVVGDGFVDFRQEFLLHLVEDGVIQTDLDCRVAVKGFWLQKVKLGARSQEPQSRSHQ